MDTTIKKISSEHSPHGYVVEGRAELHVGEQTVALEPGDSWLVPAGAEHYYTVLEPMTAIEATSPPARVEARDRA